ncbi:MAG: Bacillithiol biosynthesis BshC, partial [Bacteroidota bacterium]
ELFIHDSLQERVDNFAQWVGDYGWAWVDAILANSNTMEQGFTIITIEKPKE